MEKVYEMECNNLIHLLVDFKRMKYRWNSWDVIDKNDTFKIKNNRVYCRFCKRYKLFAKVWNEGEMAEKYILKKYKELLFDQEMKKILNEGK